MFFALHKSSRWRQHAGWTARVVLSIVVLVAASGVAAPSALATTTLQRGDVLVSGNVYAPDGTLKGTFGSGSVGGTLCFDPSGGHLVAPGVGLFDSAGNALPSHWASVAPGPECAVDGFGHVYLSGGPSGETTWTTWGTIRKFDLVGNLLRSYTVDTTGANFSPSTYGLDVTPNPCTIYYGAVGGGEIYRYNVCANSQDSYLTLLGGELDQFRVRPNWQVAFAIDEGVGLFDPSSHYTYAFDFDAWVQTRSMSLDPDGTSVWVDCFPPYLGICRVVPTTGQVLASWSAGGSVAAYGPPLLGKADVSGNIDYNASGTAEAFATRVGYSGRMSSLDLYVDSSSTASHAVVGIYSDKNGHPGTLQGQAMSNVMAGSWNYVQVPSLSVTAGQRLWISVLGPGGGGTIRFRDTASGAGSETSAQHNLTVLPARWSTGKTWATGNLSAYGS